MKYKVWDNSPGGRVVLQYTVAGKTYVEIEFENSPGVTYTYILES